MSEKAELDRIALLYGGKDYFTSHEARTFCLASKKEFRALTEATGLRSFEFMAARHGSAYTNRYSPPAPQPIRRSRR